MKKLFALLMMFLFTASALFAQKAETTEKTVTKVNPASLSNEFYAGYGGFSIFYFTGISTSSYNLVYGTNLNEAQSAGTVFLGYQRSLNKVVAMGFVFGYQNFHKDGTGYSSSIGTTTPVTVDDNLLMGMARVTFCYLNKRIIHMYSGIGVGVTIDLEKERADNTFDTDRKLLPGGELTLMGIRFGRAFGGFVEFGIGTYGILNAGLSYKFAD
jgi:hypothetical protein